jgi:hypothetical protein
LSIPRRKWAIVAHDTRAVYERFWTKSGAERYKAAMCNARRGCVPMAWTLDVVHADAASA